MMRLRLVIDTNIIVSALVFKSSKIAWQNDQLPNTEIILTDNFLS